MSSAPPSTALVAKPSELFRERAVARYYVAAEGCFESPPALDLLDQSSRIQHNFVPKSNADTALNAFAQLATLRLNASRSFISLIDSTHQYVLAEATKTLSSQSDSTHGVDDALLVGSAVVPRDALFCGQFMPTASERNSAGHESGSRQHGCTIITDLGESREFRDHPWVTGPPFLRFYAGVPLVTLDGHVVGSYCVFASTQLKDLAAEEQQFLMDMSATIMAHLESVRIRVENSRQEKLVRGLESFIDGFSEMKALHNENVKVRSPDTRAEDDRLKERRAEQDQKRAASGDSMSSWELSLPQGARSMFSRASNILRQSSDFDGVIYFHMSSEHYSNSASAETAKSRYQSDKPKQRSHDQSDFSTLSEGTGPDSDIAQSPNAVLGFSVRPGLNTDNDELSFSVTNRELEKVIGKRIKGRTLALSKAGPVLPGDTSSGASGTDPDMAQSRSVASPRNSTTARIAILQKLDSSAKSFAILPLWDFEQQRWFALCVCWTRKSSRDLSIEMPFLRIFSNLTIYSLSHLNAIQSDKAKATFISNISHELRTPLHGILGGANMLSDGSLDHFQQEMIDSITSCGRTLDDTLTDLLEYSKINSSDLSKGSSKKLKPSKQSPNQRTNTQAISITTKPVDVALVVEEAVEAVLMGWTFRTSVNQRDNHGSTFTFNVDPKAIPKREKAHEQQSRGSIRIILDIHPDAVGKFQTSPGMWRRFVLILVSNSMKYTRSGQIAVSLKVTKADDNPGLCKLGLLVTDTGCGISQDFKHKHLFRPYAQEDPLSSGTGLGLSIIDSLVRRAGGTLEVSSEKEVGTDIYVALTLERKDDRNALEEPIEESELRYNRMRLRHLRICVLTGTGHNTYLSDAAQDHEQQYVAKLGECIKNWFEIDVEVHTSWQPGSADLVICSECSFKALADIRSTSNTQKMPPVLFIAYDAIEVSVLRADARILSAESVVEVMSQPCGPRKLGKVLIKMLDRQSEQAESPTKSPDSQEKTASSKQQRIKLPTRTVTGSKNTNDSGSASSEQAIASTRNTPPVLVVDDNSLNRKLLATFIKRKNLSYESAEDGQQAVNAYKKARGRFLCVLMDISMPVMDGNTATRIIRRYESQEGLSRTKIIALTGLASATARYEAEEAGIDLYYTKPVSFPQLGGLLEDMLDDDSSDADTNKSASVNASSNGDADKGAYRTEQVGI